MTWYHFYEGDKFHKGNFESPKTLKSGQVAIEPLIVGVCGSDIHRLGHSIPNPSIGHEWVGRVTDSASADFKVNNIVTSVAHISCGGCTACKDKRPENCPDKMLLGDGPESSVLSERIILNEHNLIKLKDSSNDPSVIKKLSFLEVAYIGDLAIKEALRIGLKKEDSIMVFGAGPVGIFTAWGLSLRGYSPIIVEPKKSRLEIAKELGLNAIPLNQLILKGEFHNKINTVIDCTGDTHGPGALSLLPRVASHFAKIVIVGKYVDKPLNQLEYVIKSLTVTWLSHHPYKDFIDSINFWDKYLDKIPNSWHSTWSFEKINEAFDSAKTLKYFKTAIVKDEEKA